MFSRILTFLMKLRLIIQDIKMINFSDINECLGNHGCNQTCSNVDGSYTCNCREGYLLQADGQSCTGEI